jgi:hydroxymethylpyrimidine/phosphomethylpyrimidine kinase
MPTALTIAGSDSGGGAGIQADLKTFAAHGVYGTSAITAVTAQNTLGVRAWQAIPPELVAAQIEAVAEDIGADAVKIGMLGSAANVRAVARTLSRLRLPHVVLDPVMIAKSGDCLLEPDAIEALRSELLPLAEVLTPNIPEAEVLGGAPIRTRDEMHAAAERLQRMGPAVVLVKGGHAGGDRSVDVASLPGGTLEIEGERIETRHTHGTGCTLSAAIAANLARGLPQDEALRAARAYLMEALRRAPGIGRGHGPLGHLWRLY